MMIKQFLVKFSALALVIGVSAACSCVDAPNLDIAPVAVAPRFDGSAYKGQEKVRSMDTVGTVAKDSRMQAVAMPLDKVFFAYDSAALSQQAQAALKDVAAYMKAKNVRVITVEGHCDERGTREYNLALGDRRAVSVKRYLASLGVSGKSITTISYGKERPFDAAHTEFAWTKNRRSVIVFK